METNLRPLRLGEILDRTAQLYRTNFGIFAGICAVTNGMVLVLALLVDGLSPAYRAIVTGQAAGKFHPWFWVAVGIISLVGFALYGVSSAAITRAVAWVNMGEPATIRSAYSSTLPRLGRYLWLMTIAFLIVLGISLLAMLALAILLAIAIVAVAFLFKASKGAALIAGAVGGIAFDIGAITAAALVGARYSLGIAACVVEDLKAREALRRSVELSKGSRGRIFLLMLLVGVIQIGLLIFVQTPFYIYTFKHHLHLPLGLHILSQIISVATNTLVGPLLAAGLTVFYFDQRVRKEGYDIEWMMQAAGMAPEPSPVEAKTLAKTISVTEPGNAPLPPAEIAPSAETPGDAHE